MTSSGSWLLMRVINPLSDGLPGTMALYPDFASRVASEQQDNSELDDSRRQELLEEALSKLPDKQRIPLTLYHFEDMSYDEIAAQLVRNHQRTMA